MGTRFYGLFLGVFGEDSEIIKIHIMYNNHYEYFVGLSWVILGWCQMDLGTCGCPSINAFFSVIFLYMNVFGFNLSLNRA